MRQIDRLVLANYQGTEIINVWLRTILYSRTRTLMKIFYQFALNCELCFLLYSTSEGGGVSAPVGGQWAWPIRSSCQLRPQWVWSSGEGRSRGAPRPHGRVLELRRRLFRRHTSECGNQGDGTRSPLSPGNEQTSDTEKGNNNYGRKIRVNL